MCLHPNQVCRPYGYLMRRSHSDSRREGENHCCVCVCVCGGGGGGGGSVDSLHLVLPVTYTRAAYITLCYGYNS